MVVTTKKSTVKKSPRKKTLTKKTPIKKSPTKKPLIKKKPINFATIKPSKLIEIALADLEKCERSKKYIIDMTHWFISNHACQVCMAGAVMAQSLSEITNKIIEKEKQNYFNEYNNIPEYIIVNPNAYDDSTYNALLALDYFRLGMVNQAFKSLKKPNPNLNDRKITSYYCDSSKFKKDIMELVQDLKKVKS